MPQDPLVYYSAVSTLAYLIARNYYHDIHYVWCAPVFDDESDSPIDAVVPPTSTPYKIYKSLKETLKRGERHGKMLDDNRAGILKGAAAKRREGIIDDAQLRDIQTMVDSAGEVYFAPLILVIPYCNVKDLMLPVPLELRASFFSAERIIPILPGDLFHIIRP